MSNDAPAAFGAEYVDWKLIRTRGAVQIVFEVPINEAGHAYEALGGMPAQGNSRWFGIAPLKKKPDATQA